MADSLHPLVDQLVQICAARGVRDWILAPGSRSAPLTVALARHPEMRCRLLFDERSAAYVALGLAQQLRTPVGLVCTSGTAAVNFGPAVVEAFYQGVPLLVLTADRPPEWIDQQDNQAIRQTNLYAPHVRGSYTLPLDDGKPDTRWFVSRIVANAVDLAHSWDPGPVHINVPLREPLYTAPALLAQTGSAAPTLRTLSSQPQLDESAWPDLLDQWHAASRKLIVAGMHPADPCLHAPLAALAADPGVAVFADVTANLHSLPFVPAHADVILGTRDAASLDRLQPDLVVNFGGQVTSKNIKMLLRSRPPKALWHVRPSLVAPDTYQALTHVVPMAAAQFFEQLVVRLGQQQRLHGDATYRAGWHALDRQASAMLDQLLAAGPFNEFAAVHHVLAALPPGSLLQAGNSMPIRYINLLGMQPGHYPAQVNGNRGTSGIDGTVSTTVGAAMSTTALTTLIVGDLGFFYDRNGLWHRHLPSNLRIVVLNNHGGGIFDIIEGPNQLEREQLETYFLTPQPLTARRTAQDHGLRYLHAAGAAELTSLLPAFFAGDAGPALLEIETDIATNTALYAEYRALATALRLD
jgi:2-succinyl-5-enolpyruvyl-6-hydroxy-3-cyclohexene-1-carboxylate synthase